MKKLIDDAKARLRQPKMRRRLVVLADQATSSLSNVLAAVLVARSFDSPEPFGAFSLAMIIFQLVAGGARSVIGHTLLSLYSHLESECRRQLIPDLQGATLAIGVTASVALAAVSAVLGGVAGQAVLALAIVLPVVLLQDTWRFVLIVDRPVATFMIDVIWLAAVIASFSLAPPEAEVGWYVISWGLSGGLGACVAIVIGGGLVGRLRPLSWIMDNREIGFRYLGEFMAGHAVIYITATSVGPIAGLGALGSVRGSQTYYGPNNTLHQGLYMAVVPEGAQSRDNPLKLQRMMISISVVLAVISALWMLVGLLLPRAWGEALLGGTWAGVRDIMVPMGVATIAAGASSGGMLGLRSLADARRSLRARLRTVPWQLVCPLGGAAIGGVMGFAIGFAIARIASAAVWWLALHNAIDERFVGGRADREEYTDVHVNSGGDV